MGDAGEPVTAGTTAAGDASAGVDPECLLGALRRLDRLIEAAVTLLQAADPARAQDRFRGLYVGADQVGRLLDQGPGGSPTLLGGTGAGTDDGPDPAALPAPLGRLREAFGLSGFELDILLLALAPEVDLRYERLFGFLHDDLTRRRPTVDLALDLLCASAAEKIRRRGHLLPGAPLLRHGLLSLAQPGPGPRPPLLAHLLVPDEQVVGYLLGDPGLDPRLAGVADVVVPTADPAALADLVGVACGLEPLARSAAALRVYFRGPAGRGQPAAAAQLAAAWRRPLVRLDLDRAAAAGSPAGLVELAARAAALRGAVLYLAPLDAAGDPGAVDHRRLLAAVAGFPGPAVVAGSAEWSPAGDRPAGVLTVAFGLPAPAARRRAWQQATARLGVGLPARSLDMLAARFRLSREQIDAAVETSRVQPGWPAGPDPTGPDPTGTGEPAAGRLHRTLTEAAAAQAAAGLARLTQRVPIRHDWPDLVLPAAELAQLRDVAGWVDHRAAVLDGWGFARHVPAGGGIAALFTGPSGTGKTLAAEVVAGRLGYQLFRVDLARVVSKYIGETEKNLDAVFAAAQDANAILFFDEADALFGKRSAVQDAHDRYANLEIAYLLQKMEEFTGVAVLATNLRDNLDRAFLRRLAFVVTFPFPDAASRRLIWQRLWPAAAPVAPDVDLDVLAAELVLSGGHLRNIAVAAAHRAAGRGGPIEMVDVLASAGREYEKLGKVPPPRVAAASAPLPGPTRAEPAGPARSDRRRSADVR